MRLPDLVRVVRSGWLTRYGTGVVCALAAALVRLPLTSILGNAFPFITFPPAILVAAWAAGFGPGVVATLLSTLLGSYIWDRGGNAILPRQFGEAVGILAFLMIGLVISGVTEVYRRGRSQTWNARREAARARREAQRARERVAAVVDSVPGVVWEAWGQPDGDSQRIDFVSSYVEQMLGYSVAEWLQTPNFWLTIVHPDDRHKAAETAASNFARAAPHVNEFRWIAKDGRVVWVETRAAVLVDEAGQPIGMRGVTFDVTAKKAAEDGYERELTERVRLDEERARLLAREREAREWAESASRTKDQFLATVSHELRTPLNAILGWASMLEQMAEPDAPTLKGLRSISRNTRTLAQLVEDVLDVSRMISGKMRLDTAPADLADIVDAAVESILPAASARNIAINIDIDSDARALTGDATRLQQVIWNLLSNGVKFTPVGGRVEVAAHRVEGHVVLTVTDSGIGIDPAFVPYVFEPFRQADGSSTRAHTGLGLGLAIVRHLVELHGGTIAAHSRGRETGAQFTVRLPAGSVRVPSRERRPALALSAADEPQRIDGIRVLIVDDDRESCEVMAEVLRRAGAMVHAAQSADEALDAVESFQPEVVLSDIAMPGRDGYSVLASIRSLEPQLRRRMPVAAVTAYARSEDRERLIRAGFDGHLPKPVDPRELTMMVASLHGLTGDAPR